MAAVRCEREVDNMLMLYHPCDDKLLIRGWRKVDKMLARGKHRASMCVCESRLRSRPCIALMVVCHVSCCTNAGVRCRAIPKPQFATNVDV